MPSEDARSREPEPRARGTPQPSAERQAQLRQLREVNEQLVVSSMWAQELADQADASRAAAETANRLKDEFLAVISHELRNPLNAILGWARLLGDGHLDPVQTANAIRVIERNARALARLIDDLLDISRLVGGGNIRIEPSPLDLVAVIQGALDEVRPAAEAKGVSVTFTSRSLPAPVAGDALRLQQVMANLLSNAVKFTPPGGRVEVRLASTGAEAEIQVADTGRGIAPEFLPHLFEPFTQADSSPTRHQAGIGLGLAIVKALVARHGGTVRADSPGPRKGATFTVRLPVLGPSGWDDGAGQPGVLTARAPALGRLDGFSVLLVEDDADGRQVLTMILELAGARVVNAGSVRDALKALEEFRPDVVVSDIGMPEQDGFALIRALRARDAAHGGDIPAVALTGYASAEDRTKLRAAGFQVHLAKPVLPPEIIAAIAGLAVTGSKDR